MNEPWCISILGYGRGVFAPGRSSDRMRSPEGDSSREPWMYVPRSYVARFLAFSNLHVAESVPHPIIAVLATVSSCRTPMP